MFLSPLALSSRGEVQFFKPLIFSDGALDQAHGSTSDAQGMMTQDLSLRPSQNPSNLPKRSDREVYPDRHKQSTVSYVAAAQTALHNDAVGDTIGMVLRSVRLASLVLLDQIFLLSLEPYEGDTFP